MEKEIEEELDCLIEIGEGACVLKVFGIYNIVVITLTDISKIYKKIILGVHPDRFPASSKEKETRCTKLLVGAWNAGKRFVN